MSRKIFNDNANDTITSCFNTIAAFWNIRKGAFFDGGGAGSDQLKGNNSVALMGLFAAQRGMAHDQ
jgi:hypothetical protein